MQCGVGAEQSRAEQSRAEQSRESSAVQYSAVQCSAVITTVLVVCREHHLPVTVIDEPQAKLHTGREQAASAVEQKEDRQERDDQEH